MSQQLATSNFSSQSLVELEGPRISLVETADSSYNVVGGNVSTAGGYIKITGSNFTSGLQVLVDTTPATAITLVSSSQINAQVPATAAGSYHIYVVDSIGGFAIKVNAISFS